MITIEFWLDCPKLREVKIDVWQIQPTIMNLATILVEDQLCNKKSVYSSAVQNDFSCYGYSGAGKSPSDHFQHRLQML